MRVFIAIDVTDDLRKGLTGIQEVLKKKGLKARWMVPENIHLTLKFLGEIDREQLKALEENVEEIVFKRESFKLTLAGLGVFPGIKRVRVLWIGVKSEKDKLHQLWKDMEKRLAGAGFPEEDRGFSAHLTLARFRNQEKSTLLRQVIEEYKDYELGDMQVDCLNIYQSHLTPQGPVYKRIARYWFEKG